MLLEINSLVLTVGSGGLTHTVSIPSYEVNVGQTALLMGTSGSGKSVFLKTLAGILKGSEIRAEGHILFKSEENQAVDLLFTEKLPTSAIRQDIFYLFQDPRSSHFYFYNSL